MATAQPALTFNVRSKAAGFGRPAQNGRRILCEGKRFEQIQHMFPETFHCRGFFPQYPIFPSNQEKGRQRNCFQTGLNTGANTDFITVDGFCSAFNIHEESFPLQGLNKGLK